MTVVNIKIEKMVAIINKNDKDDKDSIDIPLIQAINYMTEIEVKYLLNVIRNFKILHFRLVHRIND